MCLQFVALCAKMLCWGGHPPLTPPITSLQRTVCVQPSICSSYHPSIVHHSGYWTGITNPDDLTTEERLSVPVDLACCSRCFRCMVGFVLRGGGMACFPGLNKASVCSLAWTIPSHPTTTHTHQCFFQRVVALICSSGGVQPMYRLCIPL